MYSAYFKLFFILYIFAILLRANPVSKSFGNFCFLLISRISLYIISAYSDLSASSKTDVKLFIEVTISEWFDGSIIWA